MKQFISAIDQIADEKGLPREKIYEAIEDAIAAAYKRDYGERSQIVRAKMNPETGETKLWQVKYVVEGFDEEEYLTGELPQIFNEPVKAGYRSEDQEPEEAEGGLRIKYNPEKHILLSEAQIEKEDAKIGEEIITPLETKTDFGRVAAQNAKQVIIQRLREVERDVIFNEFSQRENEVVSGTIQRKEGSMVFVDLGRTNGLLIPSEQIRSDGYRIGQRLRFLILRVEQSSKGPAVILSRAHPQLVKELFRLEVPEIEADSVQIKSVAREAGFRSKVAVISVEEGVDPIGSLVGQRGVRVQTVINELAGEKIDIIEWNDDPKVFIANALSPAKVGKVSIVSEGERHAVVEVADDQFSLAIGRQGQNVRLAAKLTGWKIDVRSPQEELTAQEVEAGGPLPEAIAEAEAPEKTEDKKETSDE